MIATADHGEMGTAHGGMRQKNFNFYEESMRVPLVYSNPKLFKTAQTNRRARLARRLPADAGEPRRRAGRRARRLAGGRLLRADPQPHAEAGRRTTSSSPTTTTSPGRPAGPIPKPPNHIVSIRERRYKLARYYDADGKVPDQWEMYDLKTDPLERVNLAHKGHKRTAAQERQYKRLQRKLAHVEKTRLQPLA